MLGDRYGQDWEQPRPASRRRPRSDELSPFERRLERLIRDMDEGKIMVPGRARQLRHILDALAARLKPFDDDPSWLVVAPNGRRPVSRLIKAPSRAVLESEARKMRLEYLDIKVCVEWPWYLTVCLSPSDEAVGEHAGLDLGERVV